MAKENKSKYAVLGVLSICPGSGYDIKKFMEQSTSNFWNESYGQIYPILKQLVEEGLAASHAEKQEGKPEKYIYTLTEQGKQARECEYDYRRDDRTPDAHDALSCWGYDLDSEIKSHNRWATQHTIYLGLAGMRDHGRLIRKKIRRRHLSGLPINHKVASETDGSPIHIYGLPT